MTSLLEHVKKGEPVEYLVVEALVKLKGKEEGLRILLLKLKKEGLVDKESKIEEAKVQARAAFAQDNDVTSVDFEVAERVEAQTFVRFRKFVVSFDVQVAGLEPRTRTEPLARLRMSKNGQELVKAKAKAKWLGQCEKAIKQNLVSHPSFYCTQDLWICEDEEFDTERCEIFARFERDVAADVKEMVQKLGHTRETLRICDAVYGRRN